MWGEIHQIVVKELEKNLCRTHIGTFGVEHVGGEFDVFPQGRIIYKINEYRLNLETGRSGISDNDLVRRVSIEYLHTIRQETLTVELHYPTKAHCNGWGYEQLSYDILLKKEALLGPPPNKSITTETLKWVYGRLLVKHK